jgi:hypothetical protein
MKVIITETQYKILKEEMYINDKGELIDDNGDDWGEGYDLEKGDVVEAIIYVGTYDFVFPGHDGDVSITGINKNGNYEGVVIEEFFDEDDSESVLHMKGYLDWNEDYDRWNFYPYYPEPEREEPTPLGEKELEYVITFGPDDNAMPKWMNRLGRWVDVDDETFEEGEDVYNSWEEWIESPYFRQDGGIDRSSGKEGDWIKKSALHSSRFGETYLKQYLKNGPMRVKRYRK